ncbi:MAG: AAA family ATPase, partial [Spirochaetales bacterium]|nr:AAA family ATPase [Spirochaetales bacterium]
MTKIKEIPYGAGDFESVQSMGDYYVDKTMYIPLLEKIRFAFLIRPRRFGKTLFISMLESYYDIKKRDRFDELFHDTWILQNPTAEQGKYLILSFNFSEVLKDKDKVQDDFNNYCNTCIDAFLEKYEEHFSANIIERINSVETAHEKIYTLSKSIRDSGVKIFLMIDEYDNFA